MKRYVVFAYSDYYPSGGGHDFYLACDSLEDAKECCRMAHRAKYRRSHVFDKETDEVVWGD